MLRGIAVVLVLIEHLYFAFWLNPGTMADLTGGGEPLPGGVDSAWYMPAAVWLIDHRVIIGTLGVGIFFLISGFVIPMSLERYSTGRFIVGRILRLYPVWIASLAVSGLALLLYGLATGSSREFSALAWLANAALVHEWFALDIINPVVWTLLIELKFYLLCALLAATVGMRRLMPMLVAVGALTLFTVRAEAMITDRLMAGEIPVARALGVLAHSAPFVCFMFLGVCIYNRHRGHWGLGRFWLGFGAIGAMWVVAVRGGVAPELWQDQTLVSFGLGVAIFCGAYLLRERIPHARPLNFLAEISYPLYAVHYVLGAILITTIYPVIPNRTLATSLALAAIVVVAYAIHRWVEVPAINLGKRGRPGGAGGGWLAGLRRRTPRMPIPDEPEAAAPLAAGAGGPDTPAP